jgi:hypothetical protein
LKHIFFSLNIISLYAEALVPLFHKPLKTSSIKFFGLLMELGGDFSFYSFIVGRRFSRKMFKRTEQMEVAWSKVGAIQRTLEDFPPEVSFVLLAVWGRALSCKSNTPLVRSISIGQDSSHRSVTLPFNISFSPHF